MKSDFQYNIDKAIILPKIFSVFQNVSAGISTKIGDNNKTLYPMNMSYKVGDDPAVVSVNRKLFFSQFGISIDNLAIPLQRHSDIVRRADTTGEYENCDALITDKSEVALIVTIADCVPIMLFDPIHDAIGLVHAGWRGTANAIVIKTIDKMRDEFKTDTKNVLAFIGPSAGVCCYEVSEEIAVKFQNKLVNYGKRKIFVDLKKENAFQLQQEGIVQGNIEISKHCTICEKELFHSYRRDGKIAGRMIAVICLK